MFFEDLVKGILKLWITIMLIMVIAVIDKLTPGGLI